jgi:hypothetical protein
MSMVLSGLQKLDTIVQSEIFYRDNCTLMTSLVSRSESGFIETMSNLLLTTTMNDCLRNPPSNLRNSYNYLENLLLKFSTSPVATYDTLAYDLLVELINSTDLEYHTRLASLLFDTIKAIYAEKRSGSAESFKTKIVLKLSNLIGLICSMSRE